MGAIDLVREADGQPMLSSKSCDGTPIRSSHRTSFTLPSGRIVRCHGRRSIEVLLQNQFLRTDIPGQGLKTRVLLTDGVALEFGKSAQAIMSAA